MVVGDVRDSKSYWLPHQKENIAFLILTLPVYLLRNFITECPNDPTCHNNCHIGVKIYTVFSHPSLKLLEMEEILCKLTCKVKEFFFSH